MQDNGLAVATEKSLSHGIEVEFLDYFIPDKQVLVLLSKVQLVFSWENAKRVHDAQVFTRIANLYRQFIENYSAFAAPITELTKDGPKKL